MDKFEEEFKTDLPFIQEMVNSEGWRRFKVWAAAIEKDMIESLIKVDSAETRGCIKGFRKCVNFPELMIRQDKELREKTELTETPGE